MQDMERIVIVGPGGAGKSRLAQTLDERCDLAVTHLDRLFWREGWTEAPLDVSVPALTAVVAGDRWVLDGNFLEHAPDDGRFARADTVIFLDLPPALCAWRIFWRWLRDRRRRRPDLPDGVSETFDPDGFKWIARYARKDRPQVLAILDDLDQGVDVHRLRSRRAVRQFLAGL